MRLIVLRFCAIASNSIQNRSWCLKLIPRHNEIVMPTEISYYNMKFEMESYHKQFNSSGKSKLTQILRTSLFDGRNRFVFADLRWITIVYKIMRSHASVTKFSKMCKKKEKLE